MAVFIFKDMNPHIWAAAAFLAVLCCFQGPLRADIRRSVAGDGTVSDVCLETRVRFAYEGRLHEQLQDIALSSE